jgi:hypothetical protein
LKIVAFFARQFEKFTHHLRTYAHPCIRDFHFEKARQFLQKEFRVEAEKRDVGMVKVAKWKDGKALPPK